MIFHRVLICSLERGSSVAGNSKARGEKRACFAIELDVHLSFETVALSVEIFI